MAGAQALAPSTAATATGSGPPGSDDESPDPDHMPVPDRCPSPFGFHARVPDDRVTPAVVNPRAPAVHLLTGTSPSVPADQPAPSRRQSATAWGPNIRQDFAARQPPLRDVRAVDDNLRVSVEILDRSRPARASARSPVRPAVAPAVLDAGEPVQQGSPGLHTAVPRAKGDAWWEEMLGRSDPETPSAPNDAQPDASDERVVHQAPDERSARTTERILDLLHRFAAQVYRDFRFGRPFDEGGFGPIPGPRARVFDTPFNDGRGEFLASSLGLPAAPTDNSEAAICEFARQRWLALGFSFKSGNAALRGRTDPWFLVPCDPVPAWPSFSSPSEGPGRDAWGRLVAARRRVTKTRRHPCTKANEISGRIPASVAGRSFYYLPANPDLPRPPPRTPREDDEEEDVEPDPLPPAAPLPQGDWQHLGGGLPDHEPGVVQPTLGSRWLPAGSPAASTWSATERGRWLALGFDIVWDAVKWQWRAYPTASCPIWPDDVVRKLEPGSARGRSGKRDSSSPHPPPPGREVRPRRAKGGPRSD